MALNGIDISSYQAGLNTRTINADFIIAKASQGTGWVDRCFNGFIDGALAAGKLAGAYHYAGGGNPITEADHFISRVRPYIGKIILVLDWEEYQNASWGNTAWISAWVSRVQAKTGVIPLIYCGPYQIATLPQDVRKKCQLWIAQYANTSPTGYQAHPWNEGAYSCFIRQYSANGRVSGWGADLDINKCYGTAAQWHALASGKKTTTNSTTRKGLKMWGIIQPNEENRLVFCDGAKLHNLNNPDQVTAIKQYAAHFGVEVKAFKMGTKKAPWFTRLAQAFSL